MLTVFNKRIILAHFLKRQLVGLLFLKQF